MKLKLNKTIAYIISLLVTDTTQIVAIFSDYSLYYGIGIVALLLFFSFLKMIKIGGLGYSYIFLLSSLLFILYIFINTDYSSYFGLIKLFIISVVLISLLMSFSRKESFEKQQEFTSTLLKSILFFGLLKIFIFIIFVDISLISIVLDSRSVRFDYADFLNPVYLARSSGLALICLLFLDYSYRRKLVVGLFLFMAVLFTASRGPIISVLVTIMFILYQRDKKLFLLSIPFLAVPGLIFFDVIYNNIVTFLTAGKFSLADALYGRVMGIEVATSMFLDSKIFGQGLGSFANYSYLGYPHNIIFEILSELGVIGILFLIMLLSQITKIQEKSLFIPLIIYTLVNSFASGSMHGNISILIFLIIGYAYSSKKYSSQESL